MGDAQRTIRRGRFRTRPVRAVDLDQVCRIGVRKSDAAVCAVLVSGGRPVRAIIGLTPRDAEAPPSQLPFGTQGVDARHLKLHDFDFVRDALWRRVGPAIPKPLPPRERPAPPRRFYVKGGLQP